LAAGEVVVVLGPSGAGKSTLFRCITRLKEPDAGEIYVGGRKFHDIGGAALAEARRDIGTMFARATARRIFPVLGFLICGRSRLHIRPGTHALTRSRGPRVGLFVS
jgi:phosphonate transport system ATP-binding protein